MEFKNLILIKYDFLKKEYMSSRTNDFSKKYWVWPSKVISIFWKKSLLKLKKEYNEEVEIKKEYYFEKWVKIISPNSSSLFDKYITKWNTKFDK